MESQYIRQFIPKQQNLSLIIQDIEGYFKICFSLSFPAMENDVVKQLGQRIRTLRKARNWSQDDLADVSGVNQKYISEIERGKVNGSINIYDALARGLSISLSELTSGIEVEGTRAELLTISQEASMLLAEKDRRILLEVIRGYLKGVKSAVDVRG